MRLRELECFRDLMVHGTMTRVAELHGLSQPAVSTMIALLEREIGFALFFRGGNRLSPTPEARLFYEKVVQGLEGVESIGVTAEQIRQGQHGQLSIAAYASVSISLLPRVLSLFLESRPGIRVKIVTRASQGVRDLLTAQQTDFGIAELPIDYPAQRMEVFRYSCQCMLPVDHPLTALDVITPKELDGVPFVSLFRGDPIHQRIARAFSDYGAHWNLVAETELFSTACELVAGGCGVGIVDSVVSRPFTGNVVRRPFRPDIEYEIAILLPLHGNLSLVASDFIDQLRTFLSG